MTAVGAREQLVDLYCAAVAGANVESLTANAVATIPLERRQRVWVFSFGKAAHAMANAAVSTLHRALAEVAGGIVVAPEPADAPSGTINVVVGDHPVDGGAVAAGCVVLLLPRVDPGQPRGLERLLELVGR